MKVNASLCLRTVGQMMMISFVICVRLDAPWTELHKLLLPILWAVIKVLALVTRVAVGALSRPAFGVVFLAEGTGLFLCLLALALGFLHLLHS